MAFVAYELTPPAEMTQEDFVRFVQDEVFPVVYLGPTRNGEITELHLLTSRAAEKYLWVIKSVDVVQGEESFVFYRTEDARKKLEASGARISAPSPLYWEVVTRVRSTEFSEQAEELNPQPLPPGPDQLNPQPLPPDQLEE
jgi:hypothetical protein